MERYTLISILLTIFIVIPAYSSMGSKVQADDRIQDNEIEVNIPCDLFYENRGQLRRDDILFFTRGDLRVGFLRDGMVIAMKDSNGVYSFEMRFRGSNDITPIGKEQKETDYNYFIGDRSRWRSGLRSFESILYRDIYDGIDIKYYMKEGNLKYDIILDPGADPSSLVMDYSGIDTLECVEEDSILISTPAGDILDSGLIAFQEDKMVDIGYRLEVYSVSFHLGDYDTDQTLIIDPLLKYSTYLGGDYGYDEPAGPIQSFGDSLIVIGTTNSVDFPTTPGSYDRSCDGVDMYVVSMSKDLSKMNWGTCFGGNNYEYGSDLVVDDSGDVFITGGTFSEDLPTTKGVINETGQLRTVMSEWGWPMEQYDIFLAKLTQSGSVLEFSTYICGNMTEEYPKIELDSNGYIYLSGETSSENFYSRNAYQENLSGYSDLFMMKIKPDASDYIYSTYLGGGDYDNLYDMDLDDNDLPTVTGTTTSQDFPTTEGAFNTSSGNRLMGFVARFKSTGSDLDFSTTLWEESNPMDISVENDGIYLTGSTYSSSIPLTKDAYDKTLDGWEDAFIAVLKDDGSDLSYCSYLGGEGQDTGYMIRRNGTGHILLTGYTYSSDFPTTPDAYSNTEKGFGDVFLTILAPERDKLSYSSVFGGSESDYCYALLHEKSNEIYVQGGTYSKDYPVTENAFDKIQTGLSSFISLFKLDSYRPEPPINLSLVAGDSNITISWKPPLWDGNEEITEYLIYRSHKNVDSAQYLDSTNVSVTKYKDTGLINGDKYYYRIKAKNIVGTGNHSNWVMGIPKRPPDEPEELNLRWGDKFIELRWERPDEDGGDPDLSYNIYCGESRDQLDVIVEDYKERIYNHTGLENGRNYFYGISAENSAGEGRMCTLKSTRPLSHPSEPINLTNRFGDCWIHLYWDWPLDDGGLERMEYEVQNSDDNISFSSIQKGIIDTDFNISGLENGKTHYLRVIAYNTVGRSKPSYAIYAISLGLPDPPRDLSGETGSGMVSLEWKPPINMGGDKSVVYNIYISEDRGKFEILEKGIETENLLVEGLKNGVVYSFAVSAVNIKGEGPRSETIDCTPYGLPSVVQNLQAETENNKIILTWNSPSDKGGAVFLSYMVYFGRSPESGLKFVGVTDVNRYEFKDLEYGVAYFMSVRAVNKIGEGPVADEISAVILKEPGILDDPIINSGDSYIDIRWKQVDDTGGVEVIRYKVYLLKAGESEPIIYETIGTNHSFTDLENGVSYTLWVRASNSIGDGPESIRLEAIPMSIPGGSPSLMIEEVEEGLKISWEIPEDDGGSEITQIMIYKGNEKSNMKLLATLDASEDSYLDMKVSEGVEYFYGARCVNEIGEGPMSEIKSHEIHVEESNDLPLIILIASLMGILLIAIVIIFTVLVFRKRVTNEGVPYYQGHQPPEFNGVYQQRIGAPDPSSARLPGENIVNQSEYDGLPPGDPIKVNPDISNERINSGTHVEQNIK